MGTSGAGGQRQPSRLLTPKRSAGEVEQFGSRRPPDLSISDISWVPHWNSRGNGAQMLLATGLVVRAEPFQAWKDPFRGRKSLLGTWCAEGWTE